MAEPRRSVDPSELKMAIDRCDNTFAGRNQHDANQFLVLLLSFIHEDLNQAPFAHNQDIDLDRYSGMELDKMINKSVVCDLFHGRMRTTITHACQHSDSVDEPLVYWSLPVAQGTTQDLGECIAQWRQRAEVTGDDTMACKLCSRQGRCTRETVAVQFSRVLIIQLKRFVMQGSTLKKNHAVVNYPVELDSGAYALESTGIYDLTGLIVHHGTVNTGHYSCLVRDPDDETKWFSISDIIVSLREAPTSRGLSDGETMTLFYQRRSEH
jgi:ubiquitin C-terminal hydrolase